MLHTNKHFVLRVSNKKIFFKKEQYKCRAMHFRNKYPKRTYLKTPLKNPGTKPVFFIPGFVT